MPCKLVARCEAEKLERAPNCTSHHENRLGPDTNFIARCNPFHGQCSQRDDADKIFLLTEERACRRHILIVVRITVLRDGWYATLGVEEIFLAPKELRLSFDTIFLVLCKLFVGGWSREGARYKRHLSTDERHLSTDAREVVR